jgi:hypothetical protein
MAQTRDSHKGRDRGCKGGDPEHPSQNGAGCPMLHGQHVRVRFPGHHVAAPSTIGIVAACVYVSLEQPLYND